MDKATHPMRGNREGVALLTAVAAVVILMTYSAILLGWAQTRAAQQNIYATPAAEASRILDSGVHHVIHTVFVLPSPERLSDCLTVAFDPDTLDDFLPVVIDFSRLKTDRTVRVGYPHDNPTHAREITFNAERTKYTVKEASPWQPSNVC